MQIRFRTKLERIEKAKVALERVNSGGGAVCATLGDGVKPVTGGEYLWHQIELCDVADALLKEPSRDGLGRKKMAGAAADMPAIGVPVEVVPNGFYSDPHRYRAAIGMSCRFRLKTNGLTARGEHMRFSVQTLCT